MRWLGVGSSKARFDRGQLPHDVGQRGHDRVHVGGRVLPAQRQPQPTQCPLGTKTDGLEDGRRLGAVSYTHLDVYKRQASDSAARSRSRSDSVVLFPGSRLRILSLIHI